MRRRFNMVALALLLSACGEHRGTHESWDCEGPWMFWFTLVSYGAVALAIMWQKRTAKPEGVAAIYQKGYEAGFAKGERIGHTKGMAEGVNAFATKESRS